MSKVKCPRCKKRSLEIAHEDCIFCGGGEYYQCTNPECYAEFDLDKEEI